MIIRLCSGQDPRTDNSEKVEYEAKFEEVPQPFSVEERQEWLEKFGNVVCSSDAFVSLSLCSHPESSSGAKAPDLAVQRFDKFSQI